MTNRDRFRQTNAFAMIDSIKLGAYWAFGFLCCVKGIGGQGLATLGTMVTITSPIFAFYLARRFEVQVREDEPVSFGKGYIYSLLLYVYSAVILALVGFAYFEWFDKGCFVNAYMMALSAPDIKESMEVSGITQTMQQMATDAGFNTFEELMRSIRPSEIFSGLLNTTILLGFFLALPTALFAKTRAKDLR